MRELGLPWYRNARSAAQRRTRAIPQPTWAAVFVTTAAVAGITWGLMQRQVPEIDPRHVIALNLAAAQLAMEDHRYIDPPERSALHYYATVLALDEANADALRGIDAIAGQYFDAAKQAIVEDRFADAVTAMDAVRRVQPNHPRLVLLETELRKGLERRVAILKHELSLATSRPEPAEEKSAAPRSRARASSTKANDAPIPTIAEIEEAELAMQRAAQLEALAREQSAMPQVEQQGASDTQSTDSAYSAVGAAYELAKGELLAARASFVETSAVQAVPEILPLAQPELPELIEPKILRWVKPTYPNAARVRGMEGWVDLLVLVSPTGDVADALVQESSGSRSFERAAVAAAKQWKYEPWPADEVRKDRIPVRVAFKLEEGDG